LCSTVPTLHHDDPYVVTRDTTAAIAIATSGIDDDDDTAPMDSQPYEPAKVIDPYMDDGLNNSPPPNSEDAETPPTSPAIPDADGCDNIEIDGAVRNVMSDLSGLKKLVKGLSDRFDEYEGRKVFKDKKVLEKELVNEKNRKEFYREFGEYMFRMLQKRQKFEDSFPLPLGNFIIKGMTSQQKQKFFKDARD
nr:hypothetical protein [Tanacetum cinerariifolium]